MLGQLIGPELKEMIANRQFNELRRAMMSFAPASLAEVFTDIAADDEAVLFRILPRDRAADIFEYLPLEKQEELLHSLGKEEVAAILNAMAPDDRTALLEELPGPVTQRLLTLLTPEERSIATQLLGYPPKSIGRRMTPDYVAIRDNWTVGQVLEHVRRVGRDKETLNVIYVVDEKGYLLDDIRLRELILADPAAPISSMMNRQFVALRADQVQEESVRAFQQFDRVALPVVDSSGHLVGMITVDDVMDVAEKEVTEDIQKMAGVTALEAPYMNVGFFTMFRKRAFCLALLFVGEMLTLSVLGYFEHELDKAAVLTFFIPLIISSGGNSGSQAGSLVIRSLAIREIKLKDWWRVLYREIGTGLAQGVVLGLMALILIFFWRPSASGEYFVRLAFAVGLSLTSVVMYGTLVGSMLPFLLRKLGLDPAVSSAPFVATLVDVFGIVIYFTIAVLTLRGTLL